MFHFCKRGRVRTKIKRAVRLSFYAEIQAIRRGILKKTYVYKFKSLGVSELLDVMARARLIVCWYKERGVFETSLILFKFDLLGNNVIRTFTPVSTPGNVIYKRYTQFTLLPHTYFIVRTSLGLMLDREAVLKKIGGEVLCRITI